MTDPLRSRTFRIASLVPAMALLVGIVALPAGASASQTGEGSAALAGDAAFATISRLGERLERLRDPSSLNNSNMDLTLRIGQPEADRTLAPFLDGVPEPVLPSLYLDGDFDIRETPNRTLELRRSTQSRSGIDLWTRGEIELGRDGSGMLNGAKSTGGVSAGFDFTLTDQAVMGLALGLDQRVGDSTVGSTSVSTYLGYRPTSATFVDMLGGVGHLSEAGGDGASRFVADLPQGFAALTFGYEHRRGAWMVSPYGRAQVARLGSDVLPGWSGKSAFRSTRASVVAGLRTDYAMEFEGISIHPGIRLEMLENLTHTGMGGPDGLLAASGFESLTFTPGIRADITPDWSARLEHRTVWDTSAASQVMELKISGRF